MFNKLSSFVLNSNKSNGLSEVFVAQPDAQKERLAGKIFLLTEFSGRKNEGREIFDFLVSSLEENYYEDEKILLREKLEDLKVENIFEAALTKTNLAFNDFLEEKKIRLNSGKDNLTIGVVFENKLHFANFGKNRALLVYRHKDFYEIINVETNAFEKESPKIDYNEESENKKLPKNPKIFSSVISGEVPKNAYFLFTSESLPEYVSEKEMINIITKLPPSSAASQIRNMLEKINNFVPFFGLIIKSASELDVREMQIENIEAKNAHESISSLNRTEKKTEEMLSSHGFVNWSKIKNRFQEIKKEKFGKFEKTSKIVRQSQEEENGPIISVLPDSEIGLVRSLSSVKKDKQLLKERFSFKKGGLAITSKISNNLPKFSVPGKEFFSNLGLMLSRKLGKKAVPIFSLSLLLVIAILFTSIYLTNKNNKNQEIRAEFERLSAEIENQQSSIESRLLYNNFEGAGEILKSMKASLESLPQKTKEQQEFYSRLSKQLEETQEKIYKISRLNNGELVADLSELNPVKIVWASDSLIVLSDKGFYDLNKDFLDSSSKDISSLSLKELSADFSMFNPQYVGDRNSLFLFNGEKLAKVDLKTKTETVSSITFPLEKDEIKSFKTFLSTDRLYLLNANKNDIAFSNKAGASYNAEASWLKEATNLQSGVDMIIDGSVFVLHNNALVEKYYTGTKETYSSIALEPLSTGFEKIIEANGNLYLFNSSEKRLAVIKKEDGFLLAQYIFDGLDEVNDFAISGQNEIFIRSGSKIFKFKTE